MRAPLGHRGRMNDSTRRSRLALLARAATFTAFAALAAPPAASAQGESGADPLAQSGEKLFVRYCAICHGKDARGDGPFAGLLRAKPADLTTIAARRGGQFPAEELTQMVDGRLVPPAHGTREMPVWGRWLGESLGPGAPHDEVARGEILAILTYLKTLQLESAATP